MFQQVFEFLIFTAGLGIIYEFSIMLLITTKSDTEVNLVNGGRRGAGLGWLAAVVLVADCPALIGRAPTLLRSHWSRASLVMLAPATLSHKEPYGIRIVGFHARKGPKYHRRPYDILRSKAPSRRLWMPGTSRWTCLPGGSRCRHRAIRRGRGFVLHLDQLNLIVVLGCRWWWWWRLLSVSLDPHQLSCFRDQSSMRLICHNKEWLEVA